LTWYEKDNLGLIDVETGAVKHNENTEQVTLAADVDGVTKEYTVYVTGTSENPYTINIDASDRSKDVSDIMWGLFFEDINSAADGGLYAELVQNRSFEMDDPLYSWETDGEVKVSTENPMNENNPTYVTIAENSSIANDGFAGMVLKAGEKYSFSMYARGESEFNISVAGDAVNLKSEQQDGWQKLTGTITSAADTDNTLLVVKNVGENDVDIDMISLIPQDTYKGHGLRKDLMEQLEAMHPKFLRFPGGCAVEGHTMDEAWNWKDTIGDVSERKEMINIWNPSATEPYMMTYGLGFYEYFQMCEDLGMEPVPILNCGMACQVRSGSAKDEEHLVPMDKLQPYIDDALDLIAFANGTDENNEWTKKRIEMGHREPFNLKYIGIGNEQYGEIYFERYAEFAKQIHEKYPDINLVTTSGTASSGNSNDLAWNWANSNTELADRMDEHYYETADWFRQHAYRYDNYRRDTNTKVFLGEYASKGNLWYNALSEAAFMTGLERNADVVRMASYAPMFAKYGNTQWSAANMIWFNNEDYVLTPNYYVQSLFSNNQGDYSLPIEVTLNGIEKDDTFKGGVVLGSWGTHNEFKDFIITSSDKQERADKKNFEAVSGDWKIRDDGVIEQTSDETGCVFYVNRDDLTDYTFTCKARKTAGGEGFQIGVAAEDAKNYYRVNVGGWGNTTAKIQHIVNGVSAEVGNVAEQSYVGSVHINDNEWYDVKVEVSEYEIKAYLNGEFICSYTKPQNYGPVYASSVYDEETGDVIVKVVNTLDSDVNVGINVNGIDSVSNVAKTTVMSGDTSLENSLENKNAIVPVDGEITNAGNSFTYAAPADSFSVIRLSADGAAHEPYISGYDDGTFRPDNTITRAEAATMISNAYGIEPNNEFDNKFIDVKIDAWYRDIVCTLVMAERIDGYDDGTFKPENPITRAEFAVLIAKGKIIKSEDSQFSDVSNHWAAGYINALAQKGIIGGYEDGTFRPDDYVTRAEAVTMINRALGREADINAQNPFSDVTPEHWAYNQILEAAVIH
ncbi:MAG: S-layer homology domain-containing protein, partial [Clostridia bacterium]|nr:S-layer homology domain-containing protein [Clostridia bacterium]